MTRQPFEQKLYLSSPTMHGDELRYVQEAYETNWMSTVGANIDTIEEELAAFIGRKRAVALSSGTAALHLAVKLAGVQPGDEVLCSDLTFAASVNPVAYEHATPVLVDSERETWNMDPAMLERAFREHPRAKAVIAVHLYGTPAKIDEIARITHEHGAVLIEDAAESLGATYRGKQTGSFGDISCISFNGNKIITGSTGGMLLTGNDAWADLARKWSTQSREPVLWYQHHELGYNYRMSNVIAGIVRGQLPYLQEHIAQKRTIRERYQQALATIPATLNPLSKEPAPTFDNLSVGTHLDVPAQDATTSNYWLTCLLLAATTTTPDQILGALDAINAEGRPIWKPMHLQPIFQAYPYVTEEDASTDIFNRGLCLPSDNKMTADQQELIIRTIRECFE